MAGEERCRPAAAYLLGPGARDAAPGERQVALDLRPALGVRNDHGVRQNPAAARPRLGHPRGSGAVARRRPGLGVAGEAREPWGVSRDAEYRRYDAGHSFQPGLGNCGRPRRPGVGRGAGLFTARSASEVRSGQRCSRSQRSSASPPRNCQPALAGLCQPAAVPRGGRGQKSPTEQPIRGLFPGKAGSTPPSGASHFSNQHREAPGNSGSCSWPRTDAANFCKKV